MKKRLPQSELPSTHVRKPRGRRGTLLVEMIVCTIMLSVVTAILLPGIHAVRTQRKATQFETLALIELNNIAAQLPLVDNHAAVQLSSSFTTRYPDASLQIDAGTFDDASLQPFQLKIIRPNGPEKPDLKRSLTVWTLSTAAEQKQESNE